MDNKALKHRDGTIYILNKVRRSDLLVRKLGDYKLQFYSIQSYDVTPYILSPEEKLLEFPIFNIGDIVVRHTTDNYLPMYFYRVLNINPPGLIEVTSLDFKWKQTEFGRYYRLATKDEIERLVVNELLK